MDVRRVEESEGLHVISPFLGGRRGNASPVSNGIGGARRRGCRGHPSCSGARRVAKRVSWYPEASMGIPPVGSLSSDGGSGPLRAEQMVEWTPNTSAREQHVCDEGACVKS